MASKRRFLLLYGSQTGQAQVIAEELAGRARERGFQPDVHCLSQSEKEFHLEKEKVVVVVVSTTGEGDPPDKAVKFWRRLKKKTVPTDHLRGCQYALLGLGDSNYTNFCNMGKMLNRRLLQLGASQFHEPGFADDGIGLELVVEPWIDGLWGPLERVLASDHETPVTGSHTTDAERLTPGESRSETGRESDGRQTHGGPTVPNCLLPENTKNTGGMGSGEISREVDGRAIIVETCSTPEGVQTSTEDKGRTRSAVVSTGLVTATDETAARKTKGDINMLTTGSEDTVPPSDTTTGVETATKEKTAAANAKPRSVEEPTVLADDLQKAMTGLAVSKGVAPCGTLDTADISMGEDPSTVTPNSSQPPQESNGVITATAPISETSASCVETSTTCTESVLVNLESSQRQVVANLIPQSQNPRTSSIPKGGDNLVKAVTCGGDDNAILSTSKMDFGMEPELDKSLWIETRTGENDGMEWVRTETQLRTLSVDLTGEQLTPPTVPPPFLRVELTEPPATGVPGFPFCEITYGMKSSISMATITGARPLTMEGAVKRTLEVDISLEGCPGLTYEPGDAFGFVCPNPEDEVEYLLQRLNLERQADYQMRLSIIADTAKKRAILPRHIPIPCSVAQFLTHCAQIRCVPKKAFLHFLSSCCHDDGEKRRLQELSSRQGASEYTRLFSELHTDFLDILYTFSSCQPPLERLVEFLPRLQPRYFSAASSPLTNRDHMRITFSVVELPKRGWSKGRRLGVATGWVTSRLGFKEVQVPVFPRVLNPFHLSKDPLQPVIMIGPGTGVAPFIGFLEHRKRRYGNETPVSGIGKSWLFFGCRHPNMDHIYQKELEMFLSEGILTRLTVAYSRLEPSAYQQRGSAGVRYVQDCLRQYQHDLAVWMMEEHAAVYVCGDAVNMSKDVRQALLEVVGNYCLEKGLRSSEKEVLEQMKEEGRYVLDVWS